MEKDERYSLFCQMIDQLDRGAYLIEKYDSLLHDYYGAVLFQAESQMIKAIGDAPGITAAALAEKFDKTPSACSQLVRKLKAKGWVKQVRNCSNSNNSSNSNRTRIHSLRPPRRATRIRAVVTVHGDGRFRDILVFLPIMEILMEGIPVITVLIFRRLQAQRL